MKRKVPPGDRIYKVYEIRNTLSGEIIYIGQTKHTLKERFKKHKTKNWGKFHGMDNLGIFLVMDHLTHRESLDLELSMQKHWDLLPSRGPLDGAVSESTRKLISDKLKERWESMSELEKIEWKKRNGNFKHSQEFLDRISEKFSGEKNPMYGQRFSMTEEQKEKVREGLKNAPRATCPVCGYYGFLGKLKKLHYENCKGTPLH